MLQQAQKKGKGRSAARRPSVRNARGTSSGARRINASDRRGRGKRVNGEESFRAERRKGSSDRSVTVTSLKPDAAPVDYSRPGIPRPNWARPYLALFTEVRFRSKSEGVFLLIAPPAFGRTIKMGRPSARGRTKDNIKH